MKRIMILCILLGLATMAVAEGITLGGALRYSYYLKSWDDANKDKGGTLDFDVFRLNVSGEKGGLGINAEYRFYIDSFGDSFLKSGYFYYNLQKETQLQLGVTQVPFGILPYTANNFFFNLPYYVGLEDDFDAGIKLTHTIKNFDLAVAYFKNIETPGAGSSRYSLDVVNCFAGADAAKANEEVNQLNFRAAWKNDLLEVGASIQYGQLYNAVTTETGSQMAYAGHVVANWKNLNLKGQYIGYKYSPENGTADDTVVYMGSFGWPYQVAAEATLASAALSYNVPVTWGPISALTFYNDYSVMMKAEDGFEDTKMNTVGCMITSGPIYTYIDYIMGQNHPWIGGSWNSGLAAGVKDADWENRININVGYYF